MKKKPAVRNPVVPEYVFDLLKRVTELERRVAYLELSKMNTPICPWPHYPPLNPHDPAPWTPTWTDNGTASPMPRRGIAIS